MGTGMWDPLSRRRLASLVLTIVTVTVGSCREQQQIALASPRNFENCAWAGTRSSDLRDQFIRPDAPGEEPGARLPGGRLTTQPGRFCFATAGPNET